MQQHPPPSQETLATDQGALQTLTARYDAALSNFERADLLDRHPDQLALLAQIGAASKASQQRTLAASASRTWQVYDEAAAQVVAETTRGELTQAQLFLRAQAEPTYADAQSALRALIQFNGRIADSVRDATLAEQQSQLVAALVAAALAFLGIALVGWIISSTLVRRLRQLRQVTQAVEFGELEQRIDVVGRDEIASVSASVNGMLDTIVGLLDVTRRQRDALTSAAERLFVNVRVAGAGDLRLSAAVSSDPIGMLANAFNFTIGRCRRFVLRTRGAVDQLDVLGRQQLNRAETFLASLQSPKLGEGSATHSAPHQFPVPSPMRGSSQAVDAELLTRAEYARELVRKIEREGGNQHLHAVSDLAEQANLSAGRISQLTLAAQAGLQQRDA
jgi:methyl-accepting chemotaxis protein